MFIEKIIYHAYLRKLGWGQTWNSWGSLERKGKSLLTEFGLLKVGRFFWKLSASNEQIISKAPQTYHAWAFPSLRQSLKQPPHIGLKGGGATGGGCLSIAPLPRSFRTNLLSSPLKQGKRSRCAAWDMAEPPPFQNKAAAKNFIHVKTFNSSPTGCCSLSLFLVIILFALVSTAENVMSSSKSKSTVSLYIPVIGTITVHICNYV